MAHAFVAHMITELDYALSGHFKGRFVIYDDPQVT